MRRLNDTLEDFSRPVKIEVYGKPVAKQRPRVGAWGAYTPKKTADYERAVAWEAKSQFRGAPISGPVTARIAVFLPIPQSWGAKRIEDACIGALLPSGKKTGDIDNIVKSILDGLNDIVWEDDSQVVDLHVIKRYATVPRAEIEVIALEEV